ncbi:zinc-binding alcohol dehydrogenase family protein [Leuconostoc lactis]|uniref:zinc-binding alcohol dehydrogenase family protein n=1 Tax=Leuconostoc lactis TaxID=1246 RepID=UPI0022E02240|nr:zinc-binding alcohol dehydrogenase family protein [Leuconostoc lactis]
MSLLDTFKQLWPFGQDKMWAVGFDQALPVEDPNVFLAKKVARPRPAAHELLVKVAASGLNPVDSKMRQSYQDTGVFRILGFDAMGEVVAPGAEVSNFAVGDKVYYTGSQRQQGAHADYQVVDARLVGHAPRALTPAEAAAVPLTAITAVEILHDAFGYDITAETAAGKSILILNGAGGVGSMLIQLAKYLGMTVITTASRLESVEWVKQLGADYILDYQQDIKAQLIKIQHEQVDSIAILQDTNTYWPLVLTTIRPFGRIASIVETTGPIDMGPLKNIGAQFSWIFMFAKGNYGVDMASQGEALNTVANLIDQHIIQSTLTTTFEGLTVENLRQATAMVEAGHMIGKAVIRHEEIG